MKDNPDIKTAVMPRLPGLRLMFSESLHEYRVSDYDPLGGPSWNDFTRLPSVTQFVHHYEPEFDQQAAAERRAQRENCRPEDVLVEWEREKDYACDMGTRVHANQENMMNGQSPENTPQNERERGIMTAGWRAINDLKAASWEPFAAEKMVCSMRYRLAGTVDAILKRGKNEVLVADWKTNRQIRGENRYGVTMLPPLQHLPSCELSRYGLQLNLYGKILIEEGYIQSTSIVRRMVVHLKPDGNYQIYDVPRMLEAEVALLDYVTGWGMTTPPF